MGVGLLHFGPPPLEMFYSRNIGLSNAGTPIRIPVGAKLTGKLGGFDVGVLNAQTDGTRSQPGENFSVARIRKEVLGRSYVVYNETRYTDGVFDGRANRSLVFKVTYSLSK